MDDTFVDRRRLAQPVPVRERVVGVATPGVRVEAAAQVEQPPDLLAVEQLRVSGCRHLATYPPSTGRSTPVTFFAASDTR